MLLQSFCKINRLAATIASASVMPWRRKKKSGQICSFLACHALYLCNMEKIQEIKKTFFAYRNGIVADSLRKAGDRHAMIFGLNIPQIVGIANSIGQDAHLARQLWNNSNSRESRLLAPMLFPSGEMSYDEACLWIEGVENVEIADNLCHKLLKKTPCAEKLFQKYAMSDSELLRYAAFRLAMNLLCINAAADRAAMLDAARNEVARDCKLTRAVAGDIVEEIESTKTA